MIDKGKNPSEWVAFLYELEDAKEHLGNLIREIEHGPGYEEANLRVDLGHVYSHLNRAWHRRGMTRDFSEAEWLQASNFPTDLDPT
jgi:hypothetical protein